MTQTTKYMSECSFNFSDSAWKRREFMTTLALLAGGSLAGSVGAVSSVGAAVVGAGGPMTIRQVIAALLADIPGAPFPGTVDTIKAGDPDQPVRGIVTTMFATDEVIAKAIKLEANFIIAHEPTFYNHADETKWLGDDPVLKAKQGVLQQHGMVVWRFHDGIHAHKPDGIRMGVLQALGWDKYYNADTPPFMTLPTASLGDIIALVKKNLGIEHLKFIGDPAQLCSKIVLLPGASGGRAQIGAIQQYQPDVLICGELNEWETSEYVRDARYLGEKIALILLGHSNSEEPGMEWLAPMLAHKVPGVKVTHVVSGDAFSWA
jgi:putative NIF3 family GTP cyclohydrolase 1 type 2